jgi:hypothetical protein
MASITDRDDPAPATKQCYSFTLIPSGIDNVTAEIENRLYDAGCGDATLGIREGTAYLAFDRGADSLADAILSAIADVNKSGIGTGVERAELTGEETISVINAYLKLRREVSGTLPDDLAHKVDEIMQAIGAHKPELLRTLLSST